MGEETAPIVVLPNQTIYIKNLNDKIKIEELKKNLRSMFKQFGEIKDIIAMKSFWRRGQAWIIFKDIESATKAIQGMSGFNYHGKEMKIDYALAKSDMIAKEDGTFEPRPKGPKKPRGILEREENQRQLFIKMQQQFMQQMQARAAANASGKLDPSGMNPSSFGAPSSSVETTPSITESSMGRLNAAGMDKQSLVAAAQARVAEAVRESHKRRALDAGMKNFQPMPDFTLFNAMSNAASKVSEASPLPNSVLFVENLPEDVTQAALVQTFGSYSGFRETRVIPSRRVAFVEFETSQDASAAMSALQGHSIQGFPIKLTFAKR